MTVKPLRGVWPKDAQKSRSPVGPLPFTCFLPRRCTSLRRGGDQGATDLDILPCARASEKPACPPAALRGARRHPPTHPPPRYSQGGQAELGHGGDAADRLQGVAGEVGRRAGPRVEQAARQRQGGGPAPAQARQRPQPPAARPAQLHLHGRPR